MTEKIKVVAYARFSSSNQREESITAQNRFIRMYADNHNMEVIGWYADHARTGKTVDRPQFQKLLSDAKNCPEFTSIIVHKFDRFSRSTEDTLHYIKLFKDYGVNVISVSENVDDSPAGRLMLTLMSSVNEYYVNNLSAEVFKGMRETALQCRWTGGTAPLGYDVVDQQLVVNEHEAKAVRLIFEMTADGYGYGEIIDKLNILGYKTKKNKIFGKNSLYSIITNPRYTGQYVFNRRTSANSLNKRNNHSYKPESEIIRIDGGCPAIVSKDLWKRANAVRRATRSSYSNAQHAYLLTGLLYCKHCGGKFHGNISRHRKKGLEYTTYRCSTRVNKHSCDAKEIRCSLIDSWVLEQFFKFFFNDSNIPVITEKINEQLKETARNNEEYNEAKSTLKILENSRDNLIDAIIQTGSNEAITAKIKEFDKQIKISESFIESYEHQNLNRTITENDVRDLIAQLRTYMQNPENLSRTKYILSQYIQRIEIGNETIKAIFKVAFAVFIKDSILSVSVHECSISRRSIIKNYSDVDYSQNYIGA